MIKSGEVGVFGAWVRSMPCGAGTRGPLPVGRYGTGLSGIDTFESVRLLREESQGQGREVRMSLNLTE